MKRLKTSSWILSSCVTCEEPADRIGRIGSIGIVCVRRLHRFQWMIPLVPQQLEGFVHSIRESHQMNSIVSIRY